MPCGDSISAPAERPLQEAAKLDVAVALQVWVGSQAPPIFCHKVCKHPDAHSES